MFSHSGLLVPCHCQPKEVRNSFAKLSDLIEKYTLLEKKFAGNNKTLAKIYRIQAKLFSRRAELIENIRKRMKNNFGLALEK